MRERLERLIGDMVEGGILFEDAVGAFERAFILKVLEQRGRQHDRRRAGASHTPQYAEQEDGGAEDQKVGDRR